MLIQHDDIANRIYKDGMSWSACRLICFLLQINAVSFNRFLDVAYIVEWIDITTGAIPPWVKGPFGFYLGG